MSKISRIKKEIQLNNWAEMFKECQSSGKSIAQWCRYAGINLKTYYYRLHKVREFMADSFCKNENQIVPIRINPPAPCTSEPESMVKIRQNGIELEFSENISSENLSKILMDYSVNVSRWRSKYIYCLWTH